MSNDVYGTSDVIIIMFMWFPGRAMHIRYLMLDNGIEFQDEVVTIDSWRDLKPKTVCD